MLLVPALLAAFATTSLVAAAALPDSAPSQGLDKRATTLSDGTSLQSGQITSKFRWQSSGILTIGGCLPKSRIKDCYTMFESAQGMLARRSEPLSARSFTDMEDLAAADDDNLAAYFAAFPVQKHLLEIAARPSSLNGSFVSPASRFAKRQVVSDCGGGGGGGGGGGPPPPPPSPRQRIEFLSWPGAVAGETWRYEWSTFLVPTATTSHFFKLWQILRRDACGGPVMSLEAKSGRVQIIDSVRGCTTNFCPSISVKAFQGRTVRHSMTIRFGIAGMIQYTAVELIHPENALITYSATGDMGASASLKFGMYRASVSGIADARSYVGDYVATRLS